MKNIKQIHRIIALIMILALSGFTILQLTQERELIIGTWIPEGNQNGKWEFDVNGIHKRYNMGVLYKTYYYTITEETAENGVVFSYLELVNINDRNDIYNYDINALNENNLALDYLGDLSEKLMLFEKQ